MRGEFHIQLDFIHVQMQQQVNGGESGTHIIQRHAQPGFPQFLHPLSQHGEFHFLAALRQLEDQVLRRVILLFQEGQHPRNKIVFVKLQGGDIDIDIEFRQLLPDPRRMPQRHPDNIESEFRIARIAFEEGNKPSRRDFAVGRRFVAQQRLRPGYLFCLRVHDRLEPYEEAAPVCQTVVVHRTEQHRVLLLQVSRLLAEENARAALFVGGFLRDIGKRAPG